MSRPNYLQAVKKRIEAAPNGFVFVAADFADVAETQRISDCLYRLEKEKIILRVLFGVYYKPEYSSLLGEYIAPAPDAVAHAIARNFGWTIVPCGDTALNLLGLPHRSPPSGPTSVMARIKNIPLTVPQSNSNARRTKRFQSSRRKRRL